MKVDEKNTIWTVSNGLSILRVVLVIPTVYFLLSDDLISRLIALGILAVGALTDFLDGYIARKLSEVTDFGKILDPLADKIAIALLTVILALQELLPLWFVIAVLMRDIIIFLGGMYIKSRTGIVVQSNWLGKWTAGVLALLVAVSMIQIDGLNLVKLILLYIATIMVVLSFLSYAKRFTELMK